MAQAKTLTNEELEQVLSYIATRNFALRNRVMLLTGMWSGMRVGEISSLKVGCVMNANGRVKPEIRLSAEQTKRVCKILCKRTIPLGRWPHSP